MQCEDEEDRTHTLKLEGAKIEGRRMKVSRTKVKMTCDDIFRFITERLQTQEEAEEMRRMIGTQHAHDGNDDGAVRVMSGEQLVIEKEEKKPEQTQPPAANAQKIEKRDQSQRELHHHIQT